MPRQIRTAQDKRKSASKRNIRPEGSALLESQLAKVVVDDAPRIPHPRRRVRVSRKAFVPFARAEQATSSDRIRDLDAKLIMFAGAKTPSKAKRLSLRHATHASSPFLLKLGRTAQRTVRETRLALDASVWHWVAPFQEPPSLDALVAEANDLHVGEVDPRLFADQFTPADANHAFYRRYHWLHRLRSPFMSWEAVSVHGSLPRRPHPTERIDADALQAEQFTHADHDQAFHAVYDRRARFRSAWSRVWRRVGRFAGEARDIERDLIVQTERSWRVPVILPRLNLARVMAGFFGLLLMASLPAGAVSLSRSFGKSVREATAAGGMALSDINDGMRGDASTQARAWRNASDRFREADAALEQANGLAVALAQALPQTRELYQSARSLLAAGNQSSQAGQLLARGIARAMQDANLRLDERLLILAAYLDEANPRLDEAARAISGVRVDRIPSSVRSQFREITAALETAQVSLRDLRTVVRLAVDIVGHDRPRTYLLVFQNQAELRPTGGFMGSIAEIVLDRGEMKKTFVPGGGPYDFRDQLLARVVPPKPLQLVASRWEFQDANWFPHFPDAAGKIRWFWSKAGQPTLDGVIAVNASLMEKLLAITGPVEMPAYGKTITAENFMLETQKAVELEYDREENKPKKIIGDLMQEMLARLRKGSREDWLRLVAEIGNAVETKDVQLFLSDENEQGTVERLGWSNLIKPTEGDALALVEANIAGQKTDAVIDEDVSHAAEIREDGSIVDTVTLTRRHNGRHGELFRGANNVAYVRMYVPKGSELMDADGFQTPSSTFFKHPLESDPMDADVLRLTRELPTTVPDVDVGEESGRTVFGGWVQLQPGQSRITTFRYRLPFTAFDLARSTSRGHGAADSRGAAYTLLLTSQPGKAGRRIETRVTLPESWRRIWSTGFSERDSSVFDGTWDRDLAFGGLFETP